MRFPQSIPLKSHCCRATLMLLLPLLPLLVAIAQEPGIYLFGQTSFHYEQVWGQLEGDFLAEGVIDTTAELPSGVIAFEYADSSGTTTFLHLAVSTNPDTTLDIFGFYIATAGELQPGEYPISTSNLFFFMVGVDSLVIPDDLDSLDLTDLLDLVQAEYKFISTTGAITFTTVAEGERGGSFSGSAIDVNLFPPVIIQVENGDFTLLSLPEAVRPETVPLQLTLTCWPNPFNPATTLWLTLEYPSPLNLAAFDLNGRLIQQLFRGSLGAGRHQFRFQPETAASGLYLIRAITPVGQISSKVIYLK